MESQNQINQPPVFIPEAAPLSMLPIPPAAGGAGVSLTEEQRNEANRQMLVRMLTKRYHLEGVDIEKEAALIKEKKSDLSANERKGVTLIHSLTTALPNLQKNIEKLEAMQEAKGTTEVAPAPAADPIPIDAPAATV